MIASRLYSGGALSDVASCSHQMRVMSNLKSRERVGRHGREPLCAAAIGFGRSSRAGSVQALWGPLLARIAPLDGREAAAWRRRLGVLGLGTLRVDFDRRQGERQPSHSAEGGGSKLSKIGPGVQ